MSKKVRENIECLCRLFYPDSIQQQEIFGDWIQDVSNSGKIILIQRARMRGI